MSDESFINKVKSLTQDIHHYFNDKKLNSLSAIKYLEYFNKYLTSLYRDTLHYPEEEFIDEINKMLLIINSENIPKYYIKFASSLEIHLVRAWYNIIRFREINPFTFTSENDILECFYIKYIEDKISEELIESIWKRISWFILTKNPNEEEYRLRFKRNFRNLSDKQYEKAYFYISSLFELSKIVKDKFPEIISNRLEKLLNTFIIHQREVFDLDRVVETNRSCVISNPISDNEIAITVPCITLAKIERKKKQEDNTPVFLGDYHMKDVETKPTINITRDQVIGKNNKIVKVTYRKRRLPASKP